MLDAGQVGTEMLYYLVGLARARRRADVHRLAQPEGLHRRQARQARRDRAVRATPASATSATQIEDGLGDAPGGGSSQAVEIYDEFHEAALQFIDPSAIKPLKVVVDGGNGMAGPMIGPLLQRLGLESDRGLLEARRQLPRPRAEPAAAGEPRVHHARGRRASRPTSGSPGTATPTAASSSTSTGEFVDGDFLTALMAESMLSQAPGRRRSSTTCARAAPSPTP